MKKVIAVIFLAVMFAAPLAKSVKADGVPLPCWPHGPGCLPPPPK